MVQVEERGLKVNVLNKVSDKIEPNILSYIVNRRIDLVINIPEPKNVEEFESVMEDEYAIRRKAVEMGIQVVTVPRVLEELLKGISSVKELKVKSLQEYNLSSQK